MEPCNCKCPCHKEEEKKDELFEIIRSGIIYKSNPDPTDLTNSVRLWLQECWDMAWTSTGFDHTKFKILLGIE